MTVSDVKGSGLLTRQAVLPVRAPHIDAGRNSLYRDPGHLPVGEDASQECQV